MMYKNILSSKGYLLSIIALTLLIITIRSFFILPMLCIIPGNLIFTLSVVAFGYSQWELKENPLCYSAKTGRRIAAILIAFYVVPIFFLFILSLS